MTKLDQILLIPSCVLEYFQPIFGWWVMPGLGRFATNVMTGLLLIGCLGVLALWCFSLRGSVWLVFDALGGDLTEYQIHDGTICRTYSAASPDRWRGDRSYTWRGMPSAYVNRPLLIVERYRSRSRGFIWLPEGNFAGFSWGGDERYTKCSIPLGLLAALLAACPVARGWVYLRRFVLRRAWIGWSLQIVRCSLVLATVCVMTLLALLWVRSWVTSDAISVDYVDISDRFQISTVWHIGKGGIAYKRVARVIFSSEAEILQPEKFIRWETQPAAYPIASYPFRAQEIRAGFLFSDFQMQDFSGDRRGRAVIVPIWSLLGVLGLITWIQGRTAIVELRMGTWKRNGRCPQCGYDIRATPERCPECGSVVS